MMLLSGNKTRKLIINSGEILKMNGCSKIVYCQRILLLQKQLTFMKEKRPAKYNMRIIHRYLGFFLAGIMAVYALSGIVLIFRDTNIFKKEKRKKSY